MVTPACKICGKAESGILKCAKCKSVNYCSRECQIKDWPTHKRSCGGLWWDSPKYRKGEDGSLHEGKMELVTWGKKAGPPDQYGIEGEDMGWGAIIAEEADDLKAKFEGEFEGDEKRLYRDWPQAFRWTCCGASADDHAGCNHHGTGKMPCTCDFCEMGKPLPDKVYKYLSESQHGMGLKLQRGPDPRSFNSETAGMNAMARKVLGMDE